MKICFIGLGSIGVRHLKNIYKVLTSRGVTFSVDAVRSSNRELPPDISVLISNQYFSINELGNDYDITFITNPTSLHFETMKLMANKTKHMFIEKPVVDSLNYDISDMNVSRGIYYVAAPLRYSSVIQWLKSFVAHNTVFAVRAICSSYLPDWRPHTDYRSCYSAKAELGGGVRIDLIHEWDYLSYLFGQPNATEQFYGKHSNLEITSEDIGVYIAKYSDKIISLHLDYFGKQTKRQIELYAEIGIVLGDLTNQRIVFQPSGEIISLKQDRDQMQMLELETFFDMVAGKTQNSNSVQMAMQTLKIALGEK